MRYIFGDYGLDTQRQELHRAWEPVKLRRKVFQVLVYLLAHHERVVPKQELLEHLWPDQFVGDEALKSCIKSLRQALGERGRTPRFTHTVHGQGYRFVAAVEERHAKASAGQALAAPDTSGPAEELPQDPTDAAFPSAPAQPEQPSAPPLEPVTLSGAWPAEPGTPEAERRHLTVLVCRLVGMPERATPLDPEALLDMVPDFHRLCAEVVRRYTGHLAQDQGDGLVVYFGYPQAHEDDARRAVYAGLEVVEAMRQCQARRRHAQGVQCAVRVGIDTGLVVMRAPGRGDSRVPLALGHPLTLAAQIQSLAPPDTVIISPATLRLVEGSVVTQVLGTYSLDATSVPLQLSQVLQVPALPSRFGVTVTKGLTPLVGREQELGLLHARWTQVRDGMGQVVVLSGEAGIGKSRLVHALTEHLAGDGHTRLECHCSPYAQQSALYPVIEQLKHRLQWRQETTPQEKFRALEAALAPSGLVLEEAVPLLAALLALPLPGPYAPLTLEPQAQKQKTLEAIVAWWLKETERQPVCLIVEDLHWVDPSTLELLSLLLDQAPTARMLVLLLGRPAFHPPWLPRSYLLHLALNRLAPPQVETMVAHLTGGKTLPTEVHRQLVAATDGVPLFVEELTRMIHESGLVTEREGHYELTGPLPPLAIPATLHDSLMARLDRLSEGKRVAQLGAVLGRQFTYALLQAVAPWDEPTLQRALGQLVDAELLYARGYPPETTYQFKHALIQEAAYQSLLTRTRQQYHQRIAQVLEAHFPETANTRPELLAHHYTEAGHAEPAIGYWQRAGQQASDRSAYLEAISHVTTGIELLKTLPETPARPQQALSLHIALGTALLVTKGHAAPEVEDAYTKALALCQQVGETPQLAQVLFGLWRFYIAQPQLHRAREIGETLLRLAQPAHDPSLSVIAHYALGTTWFWLGAFPAARQHLEDGIAHYTPDQYGARVFHIGQDPRVACRAYGAMILWLLGYPAQALARLHEALAWAHQVSHPFSLAWAQSWAAIVSQTRRDVPAVLTHADATVTLSIEQGFRFWAAQGTVFRGWALTMQGQGEEGLAQARQGLAAYRATKAVAFVPYLSTCVAEVYDHLGQPEDGLRALAEAHTLMEQHEDRWWEAEVSRLRGVLLLRQPGTPQAEVEAWLQRALDVARRQEAKSLELRAAMSLSRLWQQQGKQAEAQALLAPIYDWFTEGFDTADLQEAKALLEELA